MSNVNTYNPSEVYLIVCGYVCEAWQDITIERNVAEAFRQVTGIRRKHTRVRNRDSSAKITINVMQTAELNDVLSEIHSQDLEDGTGRLELTLVDKSGNSLFQSIEAYIVGYPPVTFSEGITFLPWTIQCQSTDKYIVGGNTQPSAPLLAEALKKLGIN